MSYNILLCGVGGQGTVLASKLLAAAAGRENMTVHSAETIGMAQRGGPVTSHVRIGEDAFSPLIPRGSADLLIAFEPSEAVRNLDYLKKDGSVIVNEISIRPVTESLRPTGYDGKECIAYLKDTIDNLVVVNADSLCADFGSSKFFNVAVLGVAAGAGFLHFSEESMIATIEETVKAQFVKTNKEAFFAGFAYGEDYAVKAVKSSKEEAGGAPDKAKKAGEEKAKSGVKKTLPVRMMNEEEKKRLAAYKNLVLDNKGKYKK